MRIKNEKTHNILGSGLGLSTARKLARMYVGDITVEPKKVVMERILEDLGKKGMRSLVTFGDGPVEIRETKKQGGLAVGVASDEIRRSGLNAAKRKRLILAGADLVVPDFSDMSSIVDLLFREQP